MRTGLEKYIENFEISFFIKGFEKLSKRDFPYFSSYSPKILDAVGLSYQILISKEISI